MRFNIESKIYTDFATFKKVHNSWKSNNETIVFTNGCFDIIHQGHIDSILKSAEMGTKLIIGLNSDQSVSQLKGINRPVFNVKARAVMLAALEFVDAVIIFNEDTPANLIAQIIPDVLVKGKDYMLHEIVGHEIVLKHGGKVETLDLVPDVSTSRVIQRIKLLENEHTIESSTFKSSVYKKLNFRSKESYVFAEIEAMDKVIKFIN